MQPPHFSPDTTLFIYYFEGRIAKDEPIVNKNYLGNWEEEGFSFLFFSAPAEDDIKKIKKNNSELQLIDTYEMTYEQWQGGRIEPRQIGSFLLVPPWFDVPEGEPSTVLILDPGVVFGNGLHPTTQSCMQAIDIACGGGKVSTVLDLGTGTGVLAMAAAKRGCNKILAVDFNYLACRTAFNNISMNNLMNQILVAQGDARPFSNIAADLLVANIHYDIMKDIISSDGFLQQKWFVLSGLLSSEAAKVEKTLSQLPVTLLQRWNNGSVWHTFLGITLQ